MKQNKLLNALSCATLLTAAFTLNANAAITEIKNLSDLEAFRDDVNKGTDYSGVTVKLLADIDLGNKEWTPIGGDKGKFDGIFDGGNYKISNLNVSSQAWAGFFGKTDSATIRDFTIENATVSGTMVAGAVVGEAIVYEGETSSFSNINLTGTIKINSLVYAGGMFGQVNEAVSASKLIVNANKESLVAGVKVGGIYGSSNSTDSSPSLENVSTNIKVNGKEVFGPSTFDLNSIGGEGVEITKNANVTLTGAGHNIALSPAGAITLKSASEITGTEEIVINEADEVLVAWAFEIVNDNNADVTVTMDVGTGHSLDDLLIFHKDNSAEWENVTNMVSGKKYDSTTGKLTFMTSEFSDYAVATAAAPEPAAFGLLAGLGALALVGARRRRSCK